MLEFNVRVHIVQTSPIVFFYSLCICLSLSLSQSMLCYSHKILCLSILFRSCDSILSLLLILHTVDFSMKIGKVIEGSTGSIHFTRSSIIRRDKYTPQYQIICNVVSCAQCSSNRMKWNTQKKGAHIHLSNLFLTKCLSFHVRFSMNTTRGCSVHCTEFC